MNCNSIKILSIFFINSGFNSNNELEEQKIIALTRLPFQLVGLHVDLHMLILYFQPNLYRLMQMSQQVIPIASMYDHLFERKRSENRVEFVSDFPLGNDAEVVSSLQVGRRLYLPCLLLVYIYYNNKAVYFILCIP